MHCQDYSHNFNRMLVLSLRTMHISGYILFIFLFVLFFAPTARYFDPEGCPPARACFAVKTLPLNAKVEIEAVAACD